jgi:hypothetical protein
MPTNRTTASRTPGSDKGPKPEPKILFQTFFKSVGPRTYAAQVKEAGNGNHFLVLTEGKRDLATGDVRKIKLFVFSEDFGEFFRMLSATAQWIRTNPVSPEIAKKRKRYWAKKDAEAPAPPAPVRAANARPASTSTASTTTASPASPAAARPAARPSRRPTTRRS